MRTIASAISKEELTSIINHYYFTTQIIITDDNKVYSKSLKKVLSTFVVNKNNRWYFKSNI